MMRNERFVKIAKNCLNDGGCYNCPYENRGSDCYKLLMTDVIERLEKQSAPVGCVDHESLAQSHSEEIRKLHDKLAEAEIAHERTQRELAEAQRELTHLRTIKSVVEAFLGVKI